jgi:hypothetical protein
MHRVNDVIAAFALLGLVPLAVATFLIGRHPGRRSVPVLAAGLIGLLLAAHMGLVLVVIVGFGAFLMGRGSSSRGARRLGLIVAAVGILGLPIMLVGLFYLASLNA